MRKKEKKSGLEQLLNTLIQRGWKPRGEKVNKVIRTGIDEFGDGYVLFDGELNGYKQRGCNMTELVSKSSGLWQFCEENKMLIGFSSRTRTKNAHESYGSILGDIEYWGSDYEYRLIESSLRDEDKLEQFLLDNIKVYGIRTAIE